MGNHRAQRAPRRRTSAAPVAGKRRASSARSPLLVRSLPSVPLMAGVAVLAISAGGAVSAADADLVGQVSGATASAGGSIGTAGQAVGQRSPVVSRDARRDAVPAEGVDAELLALAEKQAAERRAIIAEMRSPAEKQAPKIKENKWVLPLGSYSLTATFGQYGRWASYHTGLDFNANSGDPIYSVANGTVTEAGYDGAYGNKTVVTLDDGTEIWYCHQTSIHVSVGDQVRGGETIGTVGVTGNVTGSHLHLEVRPGGDDPMDPFDAFVDHGIVP